MSCNGRYADANDVMVLMCKEFNEDEEAEINKKLEFAAAYINGALAASGACDCTLASWAGIYLMDLNVKIMGAFYSCPCMRISPEEREAYGDWANEQLRQIRVGEMELCDGATGSDFPSAAVAQQSHTTWTAARIIYNDFLRSG